MGSNELDYRAQIGPKDIEINAVKIAHEEYAIGETFAHLQFDFRFRLENDRLQITELGYSAVLPENMTEVPILVLFGENLLWLHSIGKRATYLTGLIFSGGDSLIWCGSEGWRYGSCTDLERKIKFDE